MENQRYPNENATPKDRISEIQFSREYGEGKIEGYSEMTEVYKDMFAKSVPLAMAYVPDQKWEDVYSPEEGFPRGTIFRRLDFPFFGDGKCRCFK